MSTIAEPPTFRLRIAEAGTANTVSLQVRWGEGRALTEDSISFPDPVPEETTRRLEAYMAEFEAWGQHGDDEAAWVEQALVEVGQALGHGLVSRPNSLRDFLVHVQRHGLEHLEVSVASTRAEPFARPWETLVLPKQQHLVSASSAGLIRTLPGSSSLFSSPRLLGLGPDDPLKIVRVVSRGRDGARRARSTALTPLWESLRWRGAVDVVLLMPKDLEGLEAVERAHIVHYDGPVGPDGHLLLGEGQVAPDAFAIALGSLGTSLLLLDPTPTSIPLSVALAEVALATLRAGITNVLANAAPRGGGGHAEHAWNQVLGFLADGWSLRRATVETRKRMQQRFIDSVVDEVHRTPAGLQTWTALHHYSTADVRFFDAALQPADPSQVVGELRRRLFGFPTSRTTTGLPPRSAQASAMQLVESARPLLVGPRGSGCTTALHQVATAAVASDQADMAFYWDFRREDYGPIDMLQMMAGALGHADPARGSEGTVFAGHGRFLLCLDNIDETLVERLAELLARAEGQGHRAVLSARAEIEGQCNHRAIELSRAEARDLAVEVDPACVTLGEAFSDALDACEGSPFLVKRLAADSGSQDNSTAVSMAEEADPVASYTRQRHAALRGPLQQLLEVAAAAGGLSVGLLMVGIERPDGARTEEGTTLWKALALPDALTFRQAIEAWRAAGFMTGHQLDQAPLSALSLPPPDDAVVGILARVVCSGLASIARRATESAEHPVFGNILAHRAELAEHIERVWFAGDRSLATRTIARLHTIMAQAGLLADFTGWARSLLERTELEVLGAEAFDETLAWLTVANLAAADPELASGERVQAAAEVLWAQVRTPGWQEGAHASLLFEPTAAFLQRVFDAQGAYQQLRALAELSLSREGEPASVARWGMVLVAVQLELGQETRATVSEESLLSRDLPDELRHRVLLQLAGVRLRRGDLDGAGLRLERARMAGAPTRQLEAELTLARGDQRGAAERFCQLWKAALAGDQTVHIDDVARRMSELTEALGTEAFDAIYQAQAAGTPTPAELGVQLQQGR